ncbi:MAG: ABC transporter permease, partial [Promicromonosporaceae bacterium]|nr:ABC transporter permease [Promicromonosporaceae bacterium]
VLLGAHFVITFVAAVLSGVLALTAAQLAFGLTAPESLGLVVLGYGLGLAAMLALGTLIAAVVPRASVGTGIGMITFFVSIILAGAMTPNGLTGALGQIGRLAPLGAATGTMSYGLTGGTFPVVEVIAMVAWTLVLAPTAVKAFRWS